jgi:DNA-directed RNA polymerase subunit RPC12/RpoP
MGWRSELEDRYTVSCAACKVELVEPKKKPGQRYLLGRACPHCGHLRPRSNT